MELKFGYGKGEQIVNVPDNNLLGVLTANEMEHLRTGPEAVKYALQNPIGAKSLRSMVNVGQKIAIIASDISRPVPSYDVLPSILEELFAAGCKASDITVVFALGSHRKHTEEEMRRLVGDKVFETVKCVDSDPDDCIHMGVTDAGTPGISDPGEEIVKHCIQNDIRIVPIPGACAFVNALICSGLDTTEFTFIGFLPEKSKEKLELLNEYKNSKSTLIFYSAPHDINNYIKDLYSVFGSRNACVVKEITKMHEECRRGTAKELFEWYSKNEPKGEIVMIIAGADYERGRAESESDEE